MNYKDNIHSFWQWYKNLEKWNVNMYMIRGIDTVSTFIIFKIYMDFLRNMFSDINHLKNVLLSTICHVWG